EEKPGRCGPGPCLLPRSAQSRAGVASGAAGLAFEELLPAAGSRRQRAIVAPVRVWRQAEGDDRCSQRGQVTRIETRAVHQPGDLALHELIQRCVIAGPAVGWRLRDPTPQVARIAAVQPVGDVGELPCQAVGGAVRVAAVAAEAAVAAQVRAGEEE